MLFGYNHLQHAQAIERADQVLKQITTERDLRQRKRPGRPVKR